MTTHDATAGWVSKGRPAGGLRGLLQSRCPRAVQSVLSAVDNVKWAALRFGMLVGVVRPRTFEFGGRRYSRFYNRYNHTWMNERAVEIPIIREMVDRLPGERVLEIGNVLSHYFRVTHDIVDKYEKAPGVINQDVAGFKSSKRYDLIVSISTFEHVGWDEPQRDPDRLRQGIHNLLNHLSSSGRLVFTAPLGHSPALDKLLKEDRLPGAAIRCLVGNSRSSQWHECDWEEVRARSEELLDGEASMLVIASLQAAGAAGLQPGGPTRDGGTVVDDADSVESNPGTGGTDR